MRVLLSHLSIAFSVLLVPAFTAEARAAPRSSSARPNILYFYVDDMGWGAIGPNGQFERKAAGQPYLVTPNLDRLAAEGVNFQRAYGCTVCSPARSSQQSGFHQGHTFADQNDPDNAKKAMRADDVLIGDVLSQAGYTTGYWGKWGYGGSESQADPKILNVQTLPTSHGYQHVVAELHHVRAHTFFQPTLWSVPAKPRTKGRMELIPNSMAPYKGNEAYPDLPALQNDALYPETAYCDDVYAFAALDFVRSQAENYNETGQPFFGLLAVQVPHAPYKEINALPEWDKAYRDLPFFDTLSEQAKHWAAMITRIDGHFGNILAALEDPNGDGDKSDSIAADTLVVFQSDNGGPQHPARIEFEANGGLRAEKGKIQEGGIRVPTMMRLPSNFVSDSALVPGTSVDLVIDVTDLLPTFCELAEAQAPLGIDGVSLVPTLLGTGHQRPREFLIHEAGNGQSIIRSDHKLIRSASGLALYDLASDPGESNDIASSHPALVKELETLLLGERVDEPVGFANTYHHWIGESGAEASDAANWSDYEYANAGITYLVDDGAPQLSWTAHMVNSGPSENVAEAQDDLAFLGLEIRGGAAKQSLVLDPDVHLTGRNEIRVSRNGSLTMNGSKVSSLRWIEVDVGGTLEGAGIIDSSLYNGGEVSVQNELRVQADYREEPDSTLRLVLDGESASLMVAGMASLLGKLEIELGPDFNPAKNSRYRAVKANAISGRFANPHDEVTAANGSKFKIEYTDSAVTLTLL